MWPDVVQGGHAGFPFLALYLRTRNLDLLVKPHVGASAWRPSACRAVMLPCGTQVDLDNCRLQ